MKIPYVTHLGMMIVLQVFDSFVDEFTDKDVAKWLPGPVG